MGFLWYKEGTYGIIYMICINWGVKMKKLTKEDIKLLGEGPQIRKYILTRYQTVADFFEKNKLNITLDSLRTYLAKNKVYSETLKCTIVNCFNVHYSDIVLSHQEQARRLAWDINTNIKLYNEKEDLEIIRATEVLLEKFDLPVEKAMMPRAKAMNCYYRNAISQSIEWFELAVQRMDNHDLNRLVQLYYELADVYGREQMDDNATMYFNKAEQIIKRNTIKEDVLFRYYYWRGKYEIDRNRVLFARRLFQDALASTISLEETAVAMQNIGLTYKKEAKYEKAIEIYDKVLDMYVSNDCARKSTVLNNKAMVMIEMQQYDEAVKLSTKAISYIDNAKDYRRYIMYRQTYVKARYLQGHTMDCYNYFDELKLANTKLVDKSGLIEDINDLAAIIKEKHLLESFADTVIEMADSKDIVYNKEYILYLKACVVQIYKKIRSLKE